MLFDTLDYALSYPLGPVWAAIIGDLKRLLEQGPDLPEGVYPLAGGLENGGAKATVSIYATRDRADGRYESHHVMADIQLLVSGEECIDIFPTCALTPSTPYDEEADIVFYAGTNAPTARLRLTPGTFALILPQDAHMPYLHAHGPATVKKIVVKLPHALLDGCC